MDFFIVFNLILAVLSILKDFDSVPQNESHKFTEFFINILFLTILKITCVKSIFFDLKFKLEKNNNDLNF